MNTVGLAGRLASDPEIKEVGSEGKKKTTFRLAVQGYKKASFFTVDCWGMTAENVAKYCSKGSFVALNGRLEQDTWENEGQKREKVLVVAENVTFGPKVDASASSEGSGGGGDSSDSGSGDSGGDFF